MVFLVDWFIVLAALLAAALFLCLRPPARRLAAAGRPRRIASARLLAQAVIGFWTAALIVAEGILGAGGHDQPFAGFAALALAAVALAGVAAYWSARALRLRRPRVLFARR